MSEWYDDRRNVALTLKHMDASGYDVSELIRAVEKPWGYGDEFESAQVWRDERDTAD